MTLSHDFALYFLWLIPLAALILIIRARKKRQTLARFADKELLSRLTPPDPGRKRFIQAVFLLTGLAALLFALAGPRWGGGFQEISRKGVDIMITVDVSASMLVEDVNPNRLERAKREIVDFLKVLGGDRVGLVAFSGIGFAQCPLTLDYAALEMFLDMLQPGLIPVPGTDLGAAITTALSGFDFQSETDKVILLITDGEDNEQQGLQAARMAAEKGVKIFIFGIGEASGGPIPSPDGQGGFLKDDKGKLILSKLDEESLQKIAQTTDGRYVRSVTGDLDLDLLYFEGIRKKTEVADLKEGKIMVHEERFTIFVLSALVLLLLEGLLDAGIKPGRRIVSIIIIVLALNTGIQTAFADTKNIVSGTEADELYRAGRFTEAEDAYAKLDMDHPKDLRFRFNRGCAAYQEGNYQEAAAAFSSVFRRAETDEMRFNAAFNLGNTAFKQKDMASAAEYFKKAIGYNPSSKEARHNLELALRAYEKMKQEQKKQNQNKPDSSSKQNTGERNQDEKAPPGKKDEKQEQNKNQDDGSGEKQEKNPDQQSASKRDETEPGASDRSQPPEENKMNGRDKANAGNRQPKEEPADLSKELEATGGPSSPEERNREAETPQASIDRKKAEALLDNMKEDQSRLIQFATPKERRRPAPSGKVW